MGSTMLQDFSFLDGQFQSWAVLIGGPNQIPDLLDVSGIDTLTFLFNKLFNT